jgi:hypothetical protein
LDSSEPKSDVLPITPQVNQIILLFKTGAKVQRFFIPQYQQSEKMNAKCLISFFILDEDTNIFSIFSKIEGCNDDRVNAISEIVLTPKFPKGDF